MKMRNYYGRRSTRTKKIRNPIRVKERIAKKGGRCAACKGRYEPGDEVTSVVIRRRVYHRGGCVPANVGQMPTASGGPVTMSAAQLATALSVSWSFGEAKMVGLLGLENALVVGIKSGSVNLTPEIEKMFEKYNKYKASALRPGSNQEEKQAMVLAATSLIKMVFNQ
jgi:hypothetical protein